MVEEQITRVQNQSSVSVEKNSRGVTYSVKIYADTPEQAEELLNKYFAVVEKRAKELLTE